MRQKYPNQPLTCKLLKSLYGLQQAPRCWFLKLCAVLLKFGFKQAVSDNSLFILSTGTTLTILFVYVDDMVLAENDLKSIEAVKIFFASQFKIKVLGHLKYFFGMEFTRSSAGIYTNKRKYTCDLLQDAGMTECKPSL